MATKEYALVLEFQIQQTPLKLQRKVLLLAPLKVRVKAPVSRLLRVLVQARVFHPVHPQVFPHRLVRVPVPVSHPVHPLQFLHLTVHLTVQLLVHYGYSHLTLKVV